MKRIASEIVEMEKELYIWRERVEIWWCRFKYFFIGYYIPIKYVIQEFFTKVRKANRTGWKHGKGKVAVVTGANRGIGFHVTKELMNYDFHVILAVRDVEAGKKAIEQIRNCGVHTGSASVIPLNLLSLKSVQQCAEIILKNHKQIDLLVNNAGVAFGPQKLTEDGLETIFQVNYLGHFLFTNLLLERMHKTGSEAGENARIVNLASVAQYGGDFNFADLQSMNNFLVSKAYFDAKLAVVTNTKYLARKFESEKLRISIFCLHPGIIPTNLWEIIPIGILARKYILWVFPLMDDVKDRVLNVALSANVENSNGSFFMNNYPEKCNWQAEDPDIQKKLWTASVRLSQLESRKCK